jgi:hypothetical protein
VVSLFTDNYETVYREEVKDLAEQQPLHERQQDKFLGVHITHKLSWSKHTKTVEKGT